MVVFSVMRGAVCRGCAVRVANRQFMRAHTRATGETLDRTALSLPGLLTLKKGGL